MLSLCTIIHAQEYKFEHLTLEDGLAANGVFSLHMDQKGFLWAGTCNGLVKYDGKRFETIVSNADQDLDLAGGCIYSIHENKEGNLWLGTYHGLYFFDVWKNELSHIPHLKEEAIGINNAIWYVYEDKNDHVWLIDNKDQLIQLDLPSQQFTYYHEGPEAGSFFENSKVAMLRVALKASPAFKEDVEGDIWIGTSEKGLLLFDQKTNAFTPFTHDPEQTGTISDNRILNIFEDRDHNIWIGTGKGLNRWDAQKKEFVQAKNSLNLPPQFRTDSVWVNLQDEKGNLWIAAKGGMCQFNPTTEEVTSFPFPDESKFVIPIHEGADGSFWGYEWKIQSNQVVLHELDRATKKYTAYISEKGKEEAVFSGIGFTEYLEDYSGVFWLGSFREGINKLDPLGRKFNPYFPQEKDVQIFRSPIGLPDITIMEDEHGILWQVMDGELSWIRQHLTDEQGNIWMINNHRSYNINGKGVSRLDTKKNTYTVFLDPSDRENNACGSSGNSLLLDSKGNIWISFWDYFTAAPGGLTKYDPRPDSFRCFQPGPDDSNSLVYESIADIHEDRKGNIWIAYNGVRGNVVLQKFDPATEEFTSYDQFKVTIWEIEEDREGMLWLGTILQGLIKFNPETGEIIKQYRREDGLAHASVQDIEIDQAGKLWLRTEFGVSKFDPLTEKFENYTTADGLLANRANGTQLAFQTEDGYIYMATPTESSQSRLIYFLPEQVQDNPHPPQLAFTDFKLFNQAVGIGGSSPLSQHISRTDEIKLSYQQNDFTVDFAALHFNRPNENEYAYKLEPNDQDWRYVGTQNSVTFSGIVPGSYTLKVKAANYDGVWQEESISLNIKIAPPFYKTWWAYLFYALLFGGIFYSARKQQIKRILEQEENKRLQELDAFKTKLYTNITHEFRTPLTVISGMAEQLAEVDTPSLKDSDWVKKTIETHTTPILRNADNLLHLVNQMLDLAKLDSGKLSIDWERNDIAFFLKYLMESLQSLAAAKQIQLVFSTKVASLEMDYDKKKVQQIVTNLVSNAIKFTPKGGKVYLQISTQAIGPNAENTSQGSRPEEVLLIQVTDTGSGIPAEHLSNIFDRFYQVDNTNTRKGEGTGIGLTLTKELTELMGGQISVESEFGKGSVFKVRLPIHRNAELGSDTQVAAIAIDRPDFSKLEPILPVSPPPPSSSLADLPLLLIIEDNPDVAAYIRSCTEQQHRVIWAENGQLGIDQALETVPDIIISDVMMPEKDGFEVTRFLKKDERTSHIPIILLTAKADMDSKIVGLEYGADAYLTKPFHKKELSVRLKKLVEQRRRLQARFSGTKAFLMTSSPPASKEESTLTEKQPDLEKAFLLKVNEAIENRLDDVSLEVPQLCQAVGMSRSQLYRKLKALTDKSIASYIRSYRLHRGRELILSTDLNIAEVAFQVGFSDPAYFSRTFLKEFSINPSDIRN